MKRIVPGLLLLMTLAWAAPAPGQWIFGKKTKVNPNQRVPELILTVKTDADERKRAHAAEELREYDTKTYTEIVPVLADVLLHDKKHTVRLEALTSLTKIRPVSTIAGQAIEKAAADDDTLRVRLQAKAALPKYHLAGYASHKSGGSTKKKQTDEPPVIDPPAIRIDPSAKVQPMPMGSSYPRPLPPGLGTGPTPTGPPIDGPSLFPK
jgi:hypothetical protein